MTTSVVTRETIGPDKARHLLEGNRGNRPLNARAVAALANDMKRGAFRFTGDAIRIGTDGRLIDGQTRLNAVVLSGCSIDTLVVRGLEDDVFNVIDIGRKRSAADSLSTNGFKNCVTLAAAARIVWVWQTDVMRYTAKMTNELTTRFVRDNPKLIALVDHYCAKKGSCSLLTPAVSSAWHYIFSGTSHGDLASDFFASVLEGENICYGMPAYALRDRLIKESHGRTRPIPLAIWGWIVKAWNAHATGRAMTKIQFGVNDSFPIVFDARKSN